MNIHIINPSHHSFGVTMITPRWLYVLAAATPKKWGDPIVTDEMLEPFDDEHLEPGDVVGIGIHTGNALVGYELGKRARARGAWVVYGGIHATLFPEEAHEQGAAHAVVRGDGDRPLGERNAQHGISQPDLFVGQIRVGEGRAFFEHRLGMLERVDL